ncbi:MAG TPA: ribonuclease P [Methanoregulaceae archaeon]|nr:ribonuclease P [Methanoregulaceae archaeon]
MSMVRNSSRPDSKRLARERIAELFRQADLMFPENPAWSHRCVHLARKIAMRQRIRIDRRFRRRFCHHCYHYLVPGVNMRARVKRGMVVITCLECRRQMRIPIRRRHE